MSIPEIKAAAGGAIVQIGTAIQASRAWLGNTIYWLKETVISWDIPGRLYILGQFLVTNIGKALDWLARTVTVIWRHSKAFSTRMFSWGATKTSALRETTVHQGKRALTYSSEQLTSASKMTCSFLATNLGIAATAAPLSLVALFYASFYAEDKTVKVALLACGACGLVLTGVALGTPTPLLAFVL